MPEHRLFDLAQGGGALLDLGIYPLQLCSMVLGTPDHVVAEGHVGETGADEQVAAVLHHAGGRLGVIKAATRVGLSNTARISGTDGWIELPGDGCTDRPASVSGSGNSVEWIDADYEGEGLRFQAIEVQRCLAAGETESPVAPLDETIALAHTMDDIRAQIGVVYAADGAPRPSPGRGQSSREA